MFKSFVSKITKVSDRLYIADISIQHDVDYVFLLVELALRTECASIVAINTVGPNRLAMDNHVAVHPNRQSRRLHLSHCRPSGSPGVP